MVFPLQLFIFLTKMVFFRWKMEKVAVEQIVNIIKIIGNEKKWDEITGISVFPSGIWASHSNVYSLSNCLKKKENILNGEFFYMTFAVTRVINNEIWEIVERNMLASISTQIGYLFSWTLPIFVWIFSHIDFWFVFIILCW